MAFVLFAAPTLLPVMRQYAKLRAEERALAGDVQRLEARGDHLVEYAAAISDSVETNEMLARKELNYRRADEKIVILPPAAPPADDAEPVATAVETPLVPTDWPVWARTAEAWAASHGLIEPLADPALRLTWMLMAGVLLVAAFALFRTRRHPAF